MERTNRLNPDDIIDIALEFYNEGIMGFEEILELLTPETTRKVMKILRGQ